MAIIEDDAIYAEQVECVETNRDPKFLQAVLVAGWKEGANATASVFSSNEELAPYIVGEGRTVTVVIGAETRPALAGVREVLAQTLGPLGWFVVSTLPWEQMENIKAASKAGAAVFAPS